MRKKQDEEVDAAKGRRETFGKKKRGNPAVGWVNEMRYGRSLSVEFFRTHGWLMMIFVVAVISLMGLRYKTKTKMVEIKRLTVELQRAESHKLEEKAGYMSLIRESQMKSMVEEKGLDLVFQEQPPFELTDD